MKIAFLQSIVNNPENVDNIISHSKYYNESIWSINLNDIRLDLLKNKGSKINLYLNYKTQSWFYQKPKPIIFHKIGVIFDDTNMGLFVIFELVKKEWVISTIFYVSKEQMDNFEEPRDLMPTIDR